MVGAARRQHDRIGVGYEVRLDRKCHRTVRAVGIPRPRHDLWSSCVHSSLPPSRTVRSSSGLTRFRQNRCGVRRAGPRRGRVEPTRHAVAPGGLGPADRNGDSSVAVMTCSAPHCRRTTSTSANVRASSPRPASDDQISRALAHAPQLYAHLLPAMAVKLLAARTKNLRRDGPENESGHAILALARRD